VNNRPAIEFNITEIFTETFEIFKKLFPNFILIYLGWFLLNSLISLGLGVGDEKPSNFIVILETTAFFVLTSVVTGVYTAAVWSYMNNNENPIKEGFTRCLEVLIHLMGSSILVIALVLVGLLLFIVPGVVVIMALSLVAPVVIIENPGVVESLKRSYELTDGHKQKIFMVLISVFIAVFIPIAIVTVVVGLPQMESILPLVNGVVTIFNTILYVVIYKKLSAE
jgi:hypothetical protein